MDRESDRFLSAFNAIEEHLREMLGEARHRTFSDLVHQAGHSHAQVPVYEQKTFRGLLTAEALSRWHNQ